MSKVFITEIDFSDFIVTYCKDGDPSDSIVVNLEGTPERYYNGIIGSNYFWTIVNDNRGCLRYFFFSEKISTKNLSKEDFLEKIAKARPRDFSWLLFHPEIFEGKYYKDGSENYGPIKT